MKKKRVSRRFLSLFVLIPALVSVSCIFARAEAYPDISGLGKLYVLTDNRQFFSRPGGGWILVSADASRTAVTPLKADGTPDCSSGTILPFVYRAAAAGGAYLYLTGSAATPLNSLLIYRYAMAAGGMIKNVTPPVSCDFSRGMRADADGNVVLATVPYGEAPGGSFPLVSYQFVALNGATCSGTPVEEPVSSPAPASSLAEPSSAPSAASSAVSSATSSAPQSAPEPESSAPASSVPAGEPQAYRFACAVTAEQLRQTLAEQNLGQTVRVTAPGGGEITAGPVGTGCLFTVSRTGQPDCAYIAVVPGDLTGTGAPGGESRALLYAYLNNEPLFPARRWRRRTWTATVRSAPPTCLR